MGRLSRYSRSKLRSRWGIAFRTRPRRRPSIYDHHFLLAGRGQLYLQCGTIRVTLGQTVGELRWGESVVEVIVTFTC